MTKDQILYQLYQKKYDDIKYFEIGDHVIDICAYQPNDYHCYSQKSGIVTKIVNKTRLINSGSWPAKYSKFTYIVQFENCKKECLVNDLKKINYPEYLKQL